VPVTRHAVTAHLRVQWSLCVVLNSESSEKTHLTLQYVHFVKNKPAFVTTAQPCNGQTPLKFTVLRSILNKGVSLLILRDVRPYASNIVTFLFYRRATAVRA
jgi:hypothetical protein